MLATIHLVRHGEVHNPDHVVYADLDGFGLSPTGRAQALSAARRLSGTRVTAVVSSPLERAVETARPIALAHGLEPTVDERLTEWRLGRRWAGVVWEELPERFPGELEAYLATPTDLEFSPERLDEVADRVEALVSQLGTEHPSGAIVLVSHQDPVQAARLRLTGRDLATLHTDKPGHAAIVTLDREGTGWRERSFWAPEEASTPFPPVDGAEGT